MPIGEAYQKSNFCLLLTPFLTLRIYEISRIKLVRVLASYLCGSKEVIMLSGCIFCPVQKRAQ